MSGLTMGGTVVGVFALLMALTGVAGASPNDASAAGRAAAAKHDSRGDAADRAHIAERRRDHSMGADRWQDARPGTWHLSGSSGTRPGARLTPSPGGPSAPASPAGPAARPPVTGRPADAVASPGGRGVNAFRPARGPAARPRPAKTAAGAGAPTAAASAARTPWYESLGALGAWSSPFATKPLHAAVHVTLPIALIIVVLIFLIVQAQIDRRDPKLTRAPISRDDDGMTFE